MNFTGRVRRKLASVTATQRRHELVGPPHLWREKRAVQIRFLKERGLQPSSTLLDIGCGTLRGGVPIIQYLDSGHYAGVDIRDEVEHAATKEIRKHHLRPKHPTLVFGQDPVDVHLGRTFDFVWAFSVFFHLTDSHLADVLGFASRHLAPEGVFYANCHLGVHEPDQWREFPIVWRTLAEYTRAASIAGLSVEDLGELSNFDYDAQGKNQHVLCMRAE